jgi:hypothetical protein
LYILGKKAGEKKNPPPGFATGKHEAFISIRQDEMGRYVCRYEHLTALASLIFWRTLLEAKLTW